MFTSSRMQAGVRVEQGGAVRKTDDLVAACGQDHRQRIADRRIVVDNKNLSAGEACFSHAFVVRS